MTTTRGSKRASDKFTLFFLGESAVAIRDTVFEAIWSFLPPVFSTDFIDGVEKEATATLKQLFSSLSISDVPCDAQGDVTSQLNEIESAMLSTLGNLNVLVSGQGRGGLAVECDKTAPQETEVCSDARHARGLGWPVLRCGGTQEALNGVETALEALEGQLALTPARADRAFEFNEERSRAARRVTSTSSKSMSFTFGAPRRHTVSFGKKLPVESDVVLISGIPFNLCTHEELLPHCEKFGPVVLIEISNPNEADDCLSARM